MQEVNLDTSSVAGSMEQQATATEEISRNVASAADGTKVAVSSLDEVAGAAHEARASAEALLELSETVASVAANLRYAVETFLGQSCGLTRAGGPRIGAIFRSTALA